MYRLKLRVDKHHVENGFVCVQLMPLCGECHVKRQVTSQERVFATLMAPGWRLMAPWAVLSACGFGVGLLGCEHEVSRFPAVSGRVPKKTG